MEILVSKTEYHIKDVDDSNYYIVYESEVSGDGNGMDSPFYIAWHPSIKSGLLVFGPVVQSTYTRGKSTDTVDEMGKQLARFLPLLGFKLEVIVKLPEIVVHIPKQLQNSSSSLDTMFLSEFKEEYTALSEALKEIIETW
jgi:hypothetical protein